MGHIQLHGVGFAQAVVEGKARGLGDLDRVTGDVAGRLGRGLPAPEFRS